MCIRDRVGSDPEKREGMARPSVTYWKDAIGRLKKNRVAMVCLCIIILLILSCVIIPWVTPFDSREQHLSCSNKGFFFSCVDERYEGQNLVHVLSLIHICPARGFPSAGFAGDGRFPLSYH